MTLHESGGLRNATIKEIVWERHIYSFELYLGYSVVEGDNRPGLGHALAKAIGDAGINVSFVMAQVVGRRYSALFGFENEADASKAATLIKRATARGTK